MIKTAIIGLGRIGATYDCQNDKSLPPRSHLGAVMRNPSFEVSALIDPNPSSFSVWADDFSKDLYFPDLQSWNSDADVIVFANHPENRAGEIKAVLTKKPKVIILEKPLATNLEHAQGIEALIKKTNTQCVINYHRRYDPNYQNVKKIISDDPTKIICRYSKGLANYASHHIDLIQHWFGDVSNIQRLSNDQAENPDFIMHLSNGTPVYVIGLDNVHYDVFDMDIFYKDTVIKIENGGCEMISKQPIDDLYYPNYAHLNRGRTLREEGQVSGMIALYEDIESYIDGKTVHLRGTTLEESIKNMHIIDHIIHDKGLNND